MKPRTRRFNAFTVDAVHGNAHRQQVQVVVAGMSGGSRVVGTVWLDIRQAAALARNLRCELLRQQVELSRRYESVRHEAEGPL